MITSPLIARPHLPPPQPNTLHTTAFSHSTQPLPLPHPSMTRLHHAARRSRLTAAFTTSPAATPRTRCCSQSPPPHLRPIRTAVTPSSMSLTRHRGRPQWSRRCATFPSVTISRPRQAPTAPTRCPERCHHQQELQKLAMWYLLLDLPNLCSVPPQDSHPLLLSAHLQIPIVCPAQLQRRTGTTVCLRVLEIKLCAATPSALWTVHASAKVCVSVLS